MPHPPFPSTLHPVMTGSASAGSQPLGTASISIPCDALLRTVQWASAGLTVVPASAWTRIPTFAYSTTHQFSELGELPAPNASPAQSPGSGDAPSAANTTGCISVPSARSVPRTVRPVADPNRTSTPGSVFSRTPASAVTSQVTLYGLSSRVHCESEVIGPQRPSSAIPIRPTSASETSPPPGNPTPRIASSRPSRLVLSRDIAALPHPHPGTPSS